MNNKYKSTNKLFFLCVTFLSGTINVFAMDIIEEPKFDPARNMYHFGKSLDELTINQKAVAPLIKTKERGVIYSLSATTEERGKHEKHFSSIKNQKESILTEEDRRDHVDAPDVHPWCTRGQLIMTYLDDETNELTQYMGSGTLIEDKYVLTAAHNIYDYKTESIPESITFFRGRKGSAHVGKAQGLRIAITHEYYDTDNDHTRKEFDIGLIELDQPLGNTLTLPTVKVFNDINIANEKVTVAGYPGLNFMYTMTGPIKRTYSNRLFYDVDTEKGQSGSGMYLEKEGTNYIVGVHAYGTKRKAGVDPESDEYKYNSGTRINAEKEKLINYWKEYFSKSSNSSNQ